MHKTRILKYQKTPKQKLPLLSPDANIFGGESSRAISQHWHWIPAWQWESVIHCDHKRFAKFNKQKQRVSAQDHKDTQKKLN